LLGIGCQGTPSGAVRMVAPPLMRPAPPFQKPMTASNLGLSRVASSAA
jgi:hypothetical protein